MSQHNGYFDVDKCNLAEFTALIERSSDAVDLPNADTILKNVPIYDMTRLRPQLSGVATRQKLMAEWAACLHKGAGVFVLQRAVEDLSVLDAATQIYQDIIAAEKQANGGGEDHFAASGANDRIWNSLQKLCEHAPDVFLKYFASTAIEAACEAWLGPNYQMTAQINLVHPGGAAQLAHRDYHLGFQTADRSAQYPAHVHDLSPGLTLQGAVAHCDMPVESGPTKLLPFSQTYRPGYVAWRRDDFRAYFEEHCIQLSLQKGDALFFNPALFHAAGSNKSTGIHRMANLLQISSAFGRAMETIDREKMSILTYPHAQAAQRDRTLDAAALNAAIASCAEGYSFPTNLDRDPPKGGLAPETQQELYRRALQENLSPEAFEAALMEQSGRRMA